MAITASGFRARASKKGHKQLEVDFDTTGMKDPNIDRTELPAAPSAKAAASKRMRQIAISKDATIAGDAETMAAEPQTTTKRGGKKSKQRTYIDVGGSRFGPEMMKEEHLPQDGDEDERPFGAPVRQGGEDADADGAEIPDDIRKLLGPIEQRKRGREASEGGIDSSGPLPLWMERQRQQGGGGPPTGAAAARKSRGGGMPPPPGRPQGPFGPPVVGGEEQKRGEGTEPPPSVAVVNIINHTDAQLTLIAVEPRSQQRVDKTLYPRQSDSFEAPMGTLISVINPATSRALFRHKVLEPMTTLAVTDAVLLQDGQVGATGKWYDNRALCIGLGVGATVVVVGIVLLVVFLVNKYAKSRVAAATAGAGAKAG